MTPRAKNFLCRACGFRAPEDRFGQAHFCPRCRGSNVVDADIWDRYKPNNPNTCRPDPPPAASPASAS